MAGMGGFFPLPAFTACRTSVSNFSNTPTFEYSMQSTRLTHTSRPHAMNLRQHASFSLSFKNSASIDGAGIEISEEDRAVFQLLGKKVSQIDLAVEFVDSRKADKHVDVDQKAVGRP